MNDVHQVVRVMTSAIAPVFLISGVGVILSSMTIRYGRVIDRVRAVLVEVRERTGPISENHALELRALYQRARHLRTTIVLASISIFLVSINIFVLFSTLMFKIVVPFFAEGTFIASLVFLIASLGAFIYDFIMSLKILKHEVKSRVVEDVLH